MGKGGRCVRLTTSPPSCAKCHEIWESKTPGTPWATPGHLRDSFTFILINYFSLLMKFEDICDTSSTTLHECIGYLFIKNDNIFVNLRISVISPKTDVCVNNILPSVRKWVYMAYEALLNYPHSNNIKFA